MARSEVHNCDCMEYMRDLPDKAFDLAVVDPPYGIGAATFGMGHTADNRSAARKIYMASVCKKKSTYAGAGKLRGRVLNSQSAKFENWDVAPSEEYFAELFRVSKNQIIWGGNYFPLPPTRCIICWDKVQPWENFSQVEVAWTSFGGPAKLFRFDNRRGGEKIHATQKPVALYAWIFKTFAEPGMSFLDTHLGSQSSRIAAWHAGLDFCGCEIDGDYYEAGCRRFDRECRGIVQVDGQTIEQPSLF